MYLKDRVPLVLNYNPFIAFSHDPNPEYNDQVSQGMMAQFGSGFLVSYGNLVGSYLELKCNHDVEYFET